MIHKIITSVHLSRRTCMRVTFSHVAEPCMLNHCFVIKTFSCGFIHSKYINSSFASKTSSKKINLENMISARAVLLVISLTSRNVASDIPWISDLGVTIPDIDLEDIIADVPLPNVDIGKIVPDLDLPDLDVDEITSDGYFSSMKERILDLTVDEIHDFFSVNEEDVNFYLYTKETQDQNLTLKIGDETALNISKFNRNLPTKIVIHGWQASGFEEWVIDFRKNYLQIGDYNIITVDWSSPASNEYFITSILTEQVGEIVSRLVKFLIKSAGLSVENLHVLGHSLGAHISGFVGRNLNGSISRITGMDPAKPNFETPVLKEPEDRLDPTDAKFVDIIHTAAGTVGYLEPLGHVDFYANLGTIQPGCTGLEKLRCSHSRAQLLFSETIIKPLAFPSYGCIGLQKYKVDSCRMDKIQIEYMGNQVDREARGIFFFKTNAEPPYGR